MVCCVSLVGVLATSCDVMDTKPMESYDEDLVWSSKRNRRCFVTEVYKSSGSPICRREYAYLESYTPNGIHSDLTNLDAFLLKWGWTGQRIWDSAISLI